MAPIDIVVVNWNSGNQLRECLASIAKTAPNDMRCRVVVIDNASTDDSLAGIESLPLPLTVIRNSENRGFAAACNQGARRGNAEYLLFLNPDMVLEANSLTIPLAFLSGASGADTGICGIQLLDERGRVARSCARLPTAAMLTCQALGLDRLLPRLFRGPRMTEWDHAATAEVEQVIGAFFLVRRRVFEQLDGFDERFFVYFEEVDFSRRARAAGWRSVYLADAQAFHRGNGSSEQVKARRLFYSLRSRLLYAAKHFSALGAAAVAGTTLFVEPWTRLAWSALRLAPREAWQTLHGFLLLWADMPRIAARMFFSSPLTLAGEGQGVRASRVAKRYIGVFRADRPHPNPLPKGEGTGTATCDRTTAVVPTAAKQKTSPTAPL